MTIHLIKLCVGISSVDELSAYIERRQNRLRRAGMPAEEYHVTRMAPKRGSDLLDGGSLYWVIKGVVQARQTLLDLRIFRDQEGIRRCRLVLDPVLVETLRQPRRPFQGWRYLRPEDAPGDLTIGAATDLPVALSAELAELGIL
jgi:hypothetical protein